ncbi:TGACG-sequence-specific DNA-binding protein TGA-1A-like [Canna indica]|uniref:TGACG-sequence-specific DNA-binding protein TGA-1A-like n=1 Tax=Canna indica TaxID=4628 RepID=A0AAQ3KWX8_9LILI|nr:TGACG-sequence-specific DNA-binding protein TGA-1A-like [Canna indica]
MSCPHEEVEPSGAAMAAADEDDAHDHFAKFFECWLTQQERDLQSLRAAADGKTGGPDDEARLRALIDRVLGHYEYYYRAKAASARRDVTPMFAPTWTSSTENLFLWVGGWRPTMAFHLLYSKSGLQLESRLADQNESPPTADLAGLTCDQLERIDRLHRRTVRLEKQISEQEAQAQETVADAQMVELSHAMAASGDAMGGADEEMERAMEGKRERMNEVLDRADELRLETLKAVVDILKPAQAVHFLIAAAELHLKVHEFGKSKDAAAAPTTGRETAASS